MIDQIEKAFYEYQTALNVQNVAKEIDSQVVELQYNGSDTYQNLEAYLSERRFILQKLNLDDFSDSAKLKRAWLVDRVIIHACLYPQTRTADLTFFIVSKDALLHVDIETVVLQYRKHLADMVK
ncbi:MAG: hypothetical protein E6Z14_25000 [Klebsiella pneumoniae]|uniref:hypothetical protein n=1 Tax=Enterobacteriaceae TaxID=543 RepID=UPI0019C112C1|nr:MULTISPECIES: hypothetical protein [Enterobacteriaceae]HAK3665857.1 hypothetical protein [Salmonella enterica]MCX9376539.1 hypothetical protein [Escherichia coli]MDU5930321.1 hypothetical protein [Klebsiella pneumoniae]UFM72133.1 hypothetical protein LO739_24335 [Leclercia adecarboxylata]WCS70530.1 hypothetical protein [Enterobacter hormaechei]